MDLLLASLDTASEVFLPDVLFCLKCVLAPFVLGCVRACVRVCVRMGWALSASTTNPPNHTALNQQRLGRCGALRAPRLHRAPAAAVHGRGQLHQARGLPLHRHGDRRALPDGPGPVRGGGRPRPALLRAHPRREHRQEGPPAGGPDGALRRGVAAGGTGRGGGGTGSNALRCLLCRRGGAAADDAGAGRLAAASGGRGGLRRGGVAATSSGPPLVR